MRNIGVLCLLALLSANLFSCKETEEDRQKRSIEMMTTQTLGLAYLEEFKLEDAEREFLKLTELAPQEKLGFANLGLVYLRMANYTEAEKQIKKAIEIDPNDADISLLLATVYQLDGHREKAIKVLKDALTLSPEHIKVLYDLSQLYSATTDEGIEDQRKAYLLKLVESAPGNLVPQLQLTEILIRQEENDKAVERLEMIHKQFPEFPKEAIAYFDNAISLLRKSDTEKAIIQFTIFHNHLKVTFPYQSGINQLKGPGGSVIGFPLISYNPQSSLPSLENGSILDLIKFTEITASAGLDIIPSFEEGKNPEFRNSTIVEAGDYDGDGDIDLYIGSYDPSLSSYQHYMFNNDMARYKDVSVEVGINHSGRDRDATFADYDNDGYLDLYIVNETGDVLYRNAERGTFENKTSGAKIGSKSGGSKALFLDMDHDGDLDLFEALPGSNLVFRNNGDGTFTERAGQMGLQGSDSSNSVDAAFGDFEDDGDVDLLVINDNDANALYANQRQGMFKEIGEISGLKNNKESSAVTVGDYNNDGFLDFFITAYSGEKSELYRNNGNGTFELEKNMFQALQNINVLDTAFFDFDNDGFLDLIVTGESTQNEGRGILLYHNDGKGNFTDVSGLLPNMPRSGSKIELFDYNDDGDLDIIVSGINGGVFLLRNDGGNLNHYVNMKLVGLRTGSAKNNYFGIGSKVEMRAGDLYQTMVVTDPNIYFGLGNRERADIIRITWTNGVPQNILLPGADQALIESQTLKGSCPFLYTWNGEGYEFVKDITWRSALGMPLGIMGGDTKYAFSDASDDYIKIEGNKLKPKNGYYSIQVTSELWETIYMDKIELVAVDHPESTDIYVPEQFSPPPFPGMQIHQVHKKYFPVSANDSKGNDLLPMILEKDDWYISNFKAGKFQGLTEMHDLILDPGEAGQLEHLKIFLRGWIFPTDASINTALSQTDKLRVKPPTIQVINNKGNWETIDTDIGFPMGKDKTVIVDLSGKFISNDHRIRILTNMEIYWDQIFFANSKSGTSIKTTVMSPAKADLHYRGFSRMYRKGGRYGPHWFDYNEVDPNSKWRDLTGNYTRYGDVLPLLTESDNAYIISNAGDETSIRFKAESLPKLKKGWKRDFLIHSVGWVKDGDINTAEGSTVTPLPYHGMSGYPSSDKDVFPNNTQLKNYHKEYNTRVVSMEKYYNSIKTSNAGEE